MTNNTLPTGILLTVSGPIGPATADYLNRGLQKAQEKQASLVIIQLDTPGGLDDSMRTIIKAILSSPIPVVTYVAPSGARAASAGTYILYASAIAAMAPGTNMGAATPVNIAGLSKPESPEKTTTKENHSEDLEAKIKNDASAYIRSLAEYRGRNVDWASKSVLQSESLPASLALKLGVIDIIAFNISDLLQKIDGKTVKVVGQMVTLHTNHMLIQSIEPDWRTRFLAIITNPTIAYMLLLLGIYGIFFEFVNPGFVIPGIVGSIAILVALYALQLLPISYVGLCLVLLGIIFMIAEVFIATFGALGVGGIIAFTIGSIMLIDTDLPGYGIPWSIILAMVATSTLFFFLIASMAIKARLRHPITGTKAMVGLIGFALEDFSHVGWVKVDGEIWHAQSSFPVYKNQRVKVESVHGLMIRVKPIEGKNEF